MRGSKGLIGKERVGRWAMVTDDVDQEKSLLYKRLFFYMKLKKIKEQAVVNLSLYFFDYI